MSGSSLSIIVAKPSDASLVAQILTEAMEHKHSRGDKAWGWQPYTIEEVMPAIEEGLTYLVYQGKQPVGTFRLLWEDEKKWGKSVEAGYIHKLATAHSVRGQRLGDEIIRLAAEEVAKKGRKLLRLDCDERNEKLCGYYEKLGFKRVGSVEVQRPHGRLYTSALFQRPV